MAAGLRRFAAPKPAAPVVRDAVERCEMCGTALDVRHGHVADLDKRHIACTCRACYLLFTVPGAARGRWVGLPEDVWRDDAHPLTVADWDTLQVPVGTAFFFVNSDLDRVVGCYPSPAGPTETELDLDGWARLAEAYPMIGALIPDVQAVFVHRGDDGVEAFLVPIDRCYALVGSVRMSWRGLDGGDEVRAVLRDFVSELRDRARQWKP
jgi:hypothetical protein